MKEEDMNTNSNVYIAIPINESDDVKSSTAKSQTSWCSPRCKIVATLLLLACSLHFVVHKLVFNDPKFVHFDHLKHPCPHHRPHGSQHHHHNHMRHHGAPNVEMMDQHPHHITLTIGQSKNMNDMMTEHSLPPPEPHFNEEMMHPFFLPPRPIPPPVEEEQEGESMDSIGESDSADSEDVWNRIADVWNTDEGDTRDVWERIADVWTGSSDSSDDSKDSLDSSDSSDSNDGENIWERIADSWTGRNHADSTLNSNSFSGDVEYVTDVWERDTEVQESFEDGAN